MRRFRMFVLFLMCLLLITPVTTYAGSKITVNMVLRNTPKKKTVSYKRNQAIQLKIKGRNLTFSSSKPAIATVSKTGIIHTRRPGKTTITATSLDTGKTAKLLLKVTNDRTVYDLANKIGSKTDYFIYLNRSAHKVYVMKKQNGEWISRKEFPCCVGKPSTPTPTGLFKANGKGLFFVTDGGNKCWFFTRIVGSYLFHSQIYAYADAPKRLVDASMGVSCSHGCVRLYLKDARWIYKWIPNGTSIYII